LLGNIATDCYRLKTINVHVLDSVNLFGDGYSTWYSILFDKLTKSSMLDNINFVPHCPEALRYAKVWGRDVVRSLTLAYAKRLFSDSNP